MFDNFLGHRIKKVRKKVFNVSQTKFSEEINKYIENKTEIEKENIFNQITISDLENKNRISKNNLVILINFLEKTKRINPNWILLEDNKSHPIYIKKIPIDKTLSSIHEEIEELGKQINQRTNDLRIIIENTGFDNL